VLKYIVSWLQNRSTTRYFEDHPTARDAIVTAVQEATRPKPISTPAPTPCNSNTPSDQAPTPLPSQYIAQGEADNQVLYPLASEHVTREGELDCYDPADEYKNLCGESHGQGSPATQQELENEANCQTIHPLKTQTTRKASSQPAILSVQQISKSGLEPITSTISTIKLLVPVNINRKSHDTNHENASKTSRAREMANVPILSLRTRPRLN
jgi:hypothetical protein